MLRLGLKYLIIILSLTAGPSAYGQSCNLTLTGSVTDDHNQEPLAFAFIAAEGTKFATISDSMGNYSLTNLCPGKYILHCDHMGCERIIDTVFITQNSIHNFHPEHHVNELGIVDFSAPAVLETEVYEAIQLDQAQIRQAKAKQLGEAIEDVQGAQNQSSGANVSKPSLHGMHSNRILVLNNEIRQEGQQWGSDHGVELDMSNANQISVIKGANSLQYGSDAIAGVIIINPLSLRRKHGIDGELNLTGNSNGQRGIVSGRIDGNFKGLPQLSYRIQGSLKKGGNIQAPNYFIDNSGFEEKNHSWSIGYLSNNLGVEIYYSDYNSEIGIFSGAHIGNLTDLQLAFSSDTPLVSSNFTYDINRPKQIISHETLKAKGFIFLTDSSKLELIYGRQFNKREEFDTHFDDATPTILFNLTTHTIDFIWKLQSSWDVSIGNQSALQTNTWDGAYFIPNYEKYSSGFYSIFSKKINSKNTIEFGGRYDYSLLSVYKWENNEVINPQHEFHNGSGNVGWKYQANDSLVFKSNIGTAWRPPTANELYSAGLHHGSAALEYGDASLNKEVVTNGNVSMKKVGKYFTLNAQAYANYFSNFIYLTPTGETELTIRGAFPVYRFEENQTMINGVDAEVDVSLTKTLNLKIGANWIRAKNIENNTYIWGIPSDNYTAKVNWIAPNFKNIKNNSLYFKVSHTTQQTRFEEDIDFLSPPAAYTLGQVGFSSEFHIHQQKIIVDFTIQNLFNSEYRNYLNRMRYFTDEMGRNYQLNINLPFEFNEGHHHHN